MINECGDRVENPIRVIGYILPGHGLSGKKQWISSDQDL